MDCSAGNGEEFATMAQENFDAVVAALKSYKPYATKKLMKRERFIESMPAIYQQHLTAYRAHLKKCRGCIDNNDLMFKLILSKGETLLCKENKYFGCVKLTKYGNGDSNKPLTEQPTFGREVLEKCQIILKQLFRDWSSGGAPEREQSYTPIIEEIERQFPADTRDPSSVCVLVPGAGTGRMVWELARRGYHCAGNENSMIMLLAGNFIINYCNDTREKYTIYPWLLDVNNNMTGEEQARAVKIPDVVVKSYPNFSMSSGGFLEVYKLKNVWDCVATCFFIDCASNVVEFVHNIYDILQPGGVWINMGPLLYHHSEMDDMESIEPPYAMLMEIIKDIGFIVEKERTGIKTRYTQSPHSMQIQEYNSVFFVCRKPHRKYLNGSYDAATVTGHYSSSRDDSATETDFYHNGRDDTVTGTGRYRNGRDDTPMGTSCYDDGSDYTATETF